MVLANISCYGSGASRPSRTRVCCLIILKMDDLYFLVIEETTFALNEIEVYIFGNKIFERYYLQICIDSQHKGLGCIW